MNQPPIAKTLRAPITSQPTCRRHPQRTCRATTVVGLDDLDVERELLEDVVDELDRGLLVVAVVDPQHPDPGAVIDRGVLVLLLAGPG